MTDDNAYRRLLGAPPLSRTGLLGDLDLSAVARALAAPPSAPPRQLSLGEALAALSQLPSPPPPPATGLGALASFLGTDTPSMTNPLSALGVPQTSGLGGAMTNPFGDYGIPMKSEPPARNIFADYGIPTKTDPQPSMTNPLNVFASPTVSDYLDGLIPKAPPVRNALTGYGIPVNPTPSPAALPDTRRKTFFSFHFDDSFRVNQVRKSGLIRPKRVGKVPVWWRDSSIYEKSKRTDDASLRRLILGGLFDTSVTCVLAGEHTWEREWVRFEIASSVKRGNALLTVYIHNLQCPNNGYGNPGPNPLDFIGVYIADDGKTYLCQQDGRGNWSQYDKITTPVLWPKYLTKITTRNCAQLLSVGATVYDYDTQDGYNNLSIWVQDAASRAGKS